MKNEKAKLVKISRNWKWACHNDDEGPRANGCPDNCPLTLECRNDAGDRTGKWWVPALLLLKTYNKLEFLIKDRKVVFLRRQDHGSGIGVRYRSL